MDIFDKAQKVLENYNAKKFHNNLKKELKNRHIPIGFFCKKIGRNPVWFSRLPKDKVPRSEVLAAIEKEFNIDILKLTGLEPENKKIRISFNNENDEEIFIDGKSIKLSIIHHKFKVILASKHRNLLIHTIEEIYKLIEDRLSKSSQIDNLKKTDEI